MKNKEIDIHGVTPKQAILIIIFSLIFALSLSSCASRKTSKSETEIKTETETKAVTETKTDVKKEVNTNIKETIKTEIDKEKNVVKEVTEIIPQDPTKESKFTDKNGNTYNLNNAKYRSEKTTDLSKEKVVTLSEYEKTKKELETALKRELGYKTTIAKLSKEIRDKNTKKEANYSFWWIFIIIGICYIIYRKYLRW